ncbi:MAG: ABC transporter substrate-binding protein [Candidatus Hodarchaeota archaeon]
MGTWNPYLHNTKYKATVFQYIYETLWNFDPFTWEPIPGLAYDWDIEQTSVSGDILDGQKFTFYLYENETWHDGTHFTAADVNHSIYLWRDSPYHTPEMWDIYRIEMPNGVEGNVIGLFVNKPGFFEWADTTYFYITPSHIWYGVTNVSTYIPENRIIGTGPYVMASHVHGEYVRLERHEDWRWDIWGTIGSTNGDTFPISSPDSVITSTATDPYFKSTDTSLSSSNSNILPNISPIFQFLEYGTILFFIVTLVIILRRKQV